MVELGKAGGHFSASRSRCGNDNEGTCCLNIIIFSVSFIADDERNIARIAVDFIVAVYLEAELL